MASLASRPGEAQLILREPAESCHHVELLLELAKDQPPADQAPPTPLPPGGALGPQDPYCDLNILKGFYLTSSISLLAGWV